uniref:Putative ovule protein n=1 Tax=Solanum chacoense TaxID=4108 RepID=A0A0V0HGN1_SOLCH
MFAGTSRLPEFPTYNHRHHLYHHFVNDILGLCKPPIIQESSDWLAFISDYKRVTKKLPKCLSWFTINELMFYGLSVIYCSINK